MNIHTRNQDIVARHVAGETLASIATGYSISRERARQIFDVHATAEDRAKMAQSQVVEEKPAGDFPKGQTRIRVHVPFAKNTNISQKAIRAGVRRWINQEFTIAPGAKGVTRIDLVLAETMYNELCDLCDVLNIPIATAVRGVIDYLEKENAK